MREIKFRAWDSEFNFWRYGFVCKLIEGARRFWAIIFETDDGELSRYYIHEEKTIGQYAGLKDKNGVEIYEGDIAIWHINGHTRTGEIYYTGQAFDMRNDATGYGYIGWDALRGEIEVIGNIYENPELLEGGVKL